MGGSGSGRRWGSRATTSAYRQLDIRQWQRSGLLGAGRSFVREAWDIDVITCVKRDEPSMPERPLLLNAPLR